MPIPFLPSTKSAFLCAFALRNPHFLAFRAQNRGFCAFLGFETLVFWHFEHKIGIFVRFLPSRPSISGVSSTKSGFLCAFGVWNPRFRAFRAQNRCFCAFLPFETPVFGHFEHKIEVFVRFWPPEPSFSGFSSTKSAFLCALVGRRPGATRATRATGATGATATTRATATTGATGTTAGTVWVADILSQLGFVWTLALYLTWLVVSSDIFPGLEVVTIT